MDIFIIDIKSADNIDKEILLDFQKRNFSAPAKLKEHCFVYLMVDRILREVYGIEERELIFVNKKPFLKSGKKFVSISHSSEYIALGFSNFDCGIDIEEMKERNFQKISCRMQFNESSKEGFYKEWTKFEAEYKLGKKSCAQKTFIFDNYTITAVSSDLKEDFEIYIQNGNIFPKART